MKKVRLGIHEDSVVIEEDLKWTLGERGFEIVGLDSQAEWLTTPHTDLRKRMDIVISNIHPSMASYSIKKHLLPTLIITARLPDEISFISNKSSVVVLHKPFLPFQLFKELDNLICHSF